MAEPTTAETLNLVHELKCAEMEASGKLFDYLMDAQGYLKNDDLAGWRLEFSPPAPMPIVKRLKQSPSFLPYIPLPPCTACGEPTLTIESQNVCETCGLIQLLGVFTACTALLPYRESICMTRAYIHFYTRVENFRTVIKFLNADSAPEIEINNIVAIRAHIGELPVNLMTVSRALVVLGLNKQYCRHKYSLVSILGGEKSIDVVPDDVYVLLAKPFKIVNYTYGIYANRIWRGIKKRNWDPKRKEWKRPNFFSYKFVVWQLLHQIGREDLATNDMLLKSKASLRNLCIGYARMCEFNPVIKFTPTP